MKYFAATLLTLIALQTAAVVWIAVSWEVARRQSIALMEETNNQFRSSVIVRESSRHRRRAEAAGQQWRGDRHRQGLEDCARASDGRCRR